MRWSSVIVGAAAGVGLETRFLGYIDQYFIAPAVLSALTYLGVWFATRERGELFFGPGSLRFLAIYAGGVLLDKWLDTVNIHGFARLLAWLAIMFLVGVATLSAKRLFKDAKKT